MKHVTVRDLWDAAVEMGYPIEHVGEPELAQMKLAFAVGAFMAVAELKTGGLLDVDSDEDFLAPVFEILNRAAAAAQARTAYAPASAN